MERPEETESAGARWTRRAGFSNVAFGSRRTGGTSQSSRPLHALDPLYSLRSWFALRAIWASFTSRAGWTDRSATPLLTLRARRTALPRRTLRTRRTRRTLRPSRSVRTGLTRFASGSGLSRNDAVLLDQFEQLLIGQARAGSDFCAINTEVTARKEECDDCKDQRQKSEQEQTAMGLARFIDFRVLEFQLCRDFYVLTGFRLE